MSIENTTGRLDLRKKPCEGFMVGREGSVPEQEAHCAGTDSTVQSRSRRKPRTPPVGREIRRGPEAGRMGSAASLPQQSGHSLSGCVECFQCSVLIVPCCV